MWWKQPILKDFQPLLPGDVLDVVVRAHALVEVGGITGKGAKRGRNFEQVFYSICRRRGVHLCESAGSRTLAEQRSASGFSHEVDAGTRSASCITDWELKHLTSLLDKNELLVFNGKALDFLQGSSPTITQIPVLRFLLSGNNVRDECRRFAALWGIMLIEPQRFPLPLLYEAVARGAASRLRATECSVVKSQVKWACRSLQTALCELSDQCRGQASILNNGMAKRASRAVIDLQEEIGTEVLEILEERYPDWLDDVAEETWREVGGW
jgi:hypothetical protein